MVNDDVYWTAVREREPAFMEAFGQAIRGEITFEAWEAWLDENPCPKRARPPTAEEEREAERAWKEFRQKIEETRERLLRQTLPDLVVK